MRYFLALLTLLFSALSTAFAAPITQPPITIGAIYNLTGEQAPLDVPSTLGAQLAVKEINQAGGILGRPLKLDLVNGESKPALLTQLAKNFAKNNNISIVFGLSDTNMVLATAPVIADAHKLFITSGATSPNLPQQIPNYLFLTCYSDIMQANALAKHAYKKLNAKTAYIMADEDTSYTILLAQYFQQAYKKTGGKVLDYQPIKKNAASINDQLNTLKKLHPAPDVIFLAAGPGEAYTLISQFRKNGFQQPILGGDSFDSTRLFKRLGAQADNIYFTTHAFIHPDNTNNKVQYFIEKYKALYHQAPTSSFAALGYDTVKLIAAAITKAGSTDPLKVRKALYELRNWSGVTGDIRYNNSPIPDKPVTIIKINNGKETLVSVANN